MIYENIEKRKDNIRELTNDLIIHFVNGAYVEVVGFFEASYRVVFYDNDNGNVLYSDTIKNNMWTKCLKSYFINWKVEVYENDELVHTEILNLKNRKVLISINSSALGDSIAWMPYAYEFYKKHNCELYVKTFWNNLFADNYDDLIFLNPDSEINGIYVAYEIGWFYDNNKEKDKPNTIPLQFTASRILGLEDKRIKPIISKPNEINPKKQVAIATNSTSGMKFWTKEGWQGVINYLHEQGYKVINVAIEKNEFENAEQIEGNDINKTMKVILESEFLIGLGSGASWLAWALDKKVVMIANFSEEWHEFTDNIIRVSNKSVCNGCWNNPNFKFDRGDWNWCPVNKGTANQFICQNSITSDMVIEQIKYLLVKPYN